MAYMCINIIYPRLRYRTYVDIRDYVVHAISGLLPMFMTQPEAPQQKKKYLTPFRSANCCDCYCFNACHCLVFAITALALFYIRIPLFLTTTYTTADFNNKQNSRNGCN